MSPSHAASQVDSRRARCSPGFLPPTDGRPRLRAAARAPRQLLKVSRGTSEMNDPKVIDPAELNDVPRGSSSPVDPEVTELAGCTVRSPARPCPPGRPEGQPTVEAVRCPVWQQAWRPGGRRAETAERDPRGTRSATDPKAGGLMVPSEVPRGVTVPPTRGPKDWSYRTKLRVARPSRTTRGSLVRPRLAVSRRGRTETGWLHFRSRSQRPSRRSTSSASSSVRVVRCPGLWVRLGGRTTSPW